MTKQTRRSYPYILSALTVMLIGTPALAQEGYVLDGFGGVHAVNGASVIGPATPYFGFDAAEAIDVLPGGAGYYVLDAFGGLHAGGSAPTPTSVPPYFGFDIARDLSLVPASSGSPMVIASPASFRNSSGSQTQFQSLFGTSFSGTAIGAGGLFPVACGAGNLVVTTNTAAGAPRPMVGTETATMTVMINEADTALSCTLAAGQSQCTDTDTVSVSIGDRVAYKLVFANIDVATNGTFYFNKGFTCS